MKVRYRSVFQPERRSVMKISVCSPVRGLQFLWRAVEEKVFFMEFAVPDILPTCHAGQAEANGALWGRLAALRVSRIRTPRYCGFDLLGMWLRRCSFVAKAKSILSTFKRVRVKVLFKRRNIESIETVAAVKADE